MKVKNLVLGLIVAAFLTVGFGVFIVVCNQLSGPAHTIAPAGDSQRVQANGRTLRFPQSTSVGRVWIRAPERRPVNRVLLSSDRRTTDVLAREGWELLSEARGPLTIPLDHQVLLGVLPQRAGLFRKAFGSSDFVANLRFLNDLRSNDLDGLIAAACGLRNRDLKYST
jgi:hypothetical protein